MTDSKQNAIVKAPQTGIARESFSSQEIQTTGETVASVLAARAKAEVEARFIVAMKRPRDWDDVRAKLMKACERPGFAGEATDKIFGSAWYKKPIGKGVEGFSVRFAEEALRCMGNMDARSTVLFEDDLKRLVQVEVLDLENNISIPTNIVINKTVERASLQRGEIAISVRTNSKGEVTYLRAATEDEVFQKQNSLISKSIRNGVLRLLPGDIQAECRERILEIRMKKDAKNPDELKKKIADGFARHNITPSHLKAYLGHDLSTCSNAELVALRELWELIDEGKTTWSQVMSEMAGIDAPPIIDETPVTGMAAIKQRLSNGKPTRILAAQFNEPAPAPEPEDDLPDSITGDSQAVEPEDAPKPSSPIFVFDELEAVAKRMYGNKGAEKIALMSKKAGFKGSKITEAEAGMLLDLLNEGAAS